MNARLLRPLLVSCAALVTLAWVPAPATAVTPHVEGGTTAITVKVADCEGCTIQPFAVKQEASGEQPYVDWNGRKQKVRSGTIRFTIPTAYTDGMSLELRAPWERGSANYVPMVTLSEGDFCWVGTTKPAATLRLIVKKLVTDGFPSGTAVIPNAYLSSLAKPKYPSGRQDLPYCQVPR